MIEERTKTHGEFHLNSRTMQDIKKVMRESQNWEDLKDCQKESLEMIAHKVGRILHGDPDFEDHWVDIAGYAQATLKCMERDGG